MLRCKDSKWETRKASDPFGQIWVSAFENTSGLLERLVDLTERGARMLGGRDLNLEVSVTVRS